MRLAELQSQMEVMLPKIEDNDPDVKEALEALETKLMSSKVDLRMIKFNCIGSRCNKKGQWIGNRFYLVGNLRWNETRLKGFWMLIVSCDRIFQLAFPFIIRCACFYIQFCYHWKNFIKKFIRNIAFFVCIKSVLLTVKFRDAVIWFSIQWHLPSSRLDSKEDKPVIIVDKQTHLSFNPLISGLISNDLLLSVES